MKNEAGPGKAPLATFLSVHYIIRQKAFIHQASFRIFWFIPAECFPELGLTSSKIPRRQLTGK